MITPELDMRVTRIGTRWHVRCVRGETVLDEMACDLQADVGWISREILRWQDKLGNSTAFTSAARERHRTQPRGRVYYKNDLDREYQARGGQQ